MPKLEYLSLRGHDLLEDEHHRLVSRERNANSLDNLRVLDLLGANVDQEFLTKYATHLDRLIF